jgi:predicted permease
MRRIMSLWRRLRSMLERPSIERRLAHELQFHIDQQTHRYVRQGMSADDARRRALLRFGGIESVKERTRDEVRPAVIEDSLRDLRFALRSLRRSPAFTALSCLTLALGIGATTAVFSVVNGVLIKPLPYPEPNRLIGLSHLAPGVDIGGDVNMSPAQYFTYREHSRTFDEIGLWSSGTATVTGDAEPERVPVVRVNASTLRALGVHPAHGRAFSPNDDVAGAPATVLVTHSYWQRRHGGDTSLIGRAITVDSERRQVIGIMPSGFTFLNVELDLLLPLRLDPSQARLGQFNFPSVGRLKPGVTIEQAKADIARVIPIWLRSWPEPGPGFGKIIENARITPAFRPLRDDVVGDIDDVLWFLMGSIGIVLLIACANVANLLLVRVETRQSELAVRAALGAGWTRVARELLLESIALSLLGGALGLALASASTHLIVAIGPETLPRLHEITVDFSVVAFGFAASLVSGLLFACVPILRHARPNMVHALRSGRTLSDGRGRHRTRTVLAVAQIAFSLILLVSSGLMIRSFVALRSVDPGFEAPEHIQLTRITISNQEHPRAESALAIQRQMADRISALPGVSAVAFASAAPMEGNDSHDVMWAEDRAYTEGHLPPVRRFVFTSPGLFQTLGTPMLAGRDFNWSDVESLRPVAIVSERVARELWGEPRAAVGKRIRNFAESPWREVIGVVGDIHDYGVHEPPAPTVYWPALVADFYGPQPRAQYSTTFMVRSTRAGTESLLSEIRDRVLAVRSNIPLAQTRTLEEVYKRSMARTSFTLVMLGIAAAMALALGIVGVYAVIAYAAAQRTREIGIRAALGATSTDLNSMFVRHGLVMAAAGISIGLAASVVVTRFLKTLLFGVNPLDVQTLLIVSSLLTSAIMLASYIPARRAAGLNPADALRTE